MPAKVNPIPAGCRTVTPYMVIQGAAAAIDFYQKAFGAEEIGRMPGPGGGIMHAELRFGDSMVYMSEECLERGVKSPLTLGGAGISIHLYVPDVDAAFQRAVAAGAQVIMPPMDMFWGDRFCKVSDPFGHQWSIASHVEDVPPEEMPKRMEEAMKAFAQG
jgi:uncharacterized glyoxalase superfamily protein PhnB